MPCPPSRSASTKQTWCPKRAPYPKQVPCSKRAPLSDAAPPTTPRERGKPGLGSVGHSRRRFIPACAGKTGAGMIGTIEFAAHPRLRGENCDDQPINLAGAGSSPLARGKHFSIWDFTPQIGQILESLESCAYAEIYSLPVAYATDSQDQAQNTASPHHALALLQLRCGRRRGYPPRHPAHPWCR